MQVQVLHAQIHTPEQVEAYIAEAHRIVEALDLSPDLVECAFGHAIDLLAAKFSMAAQPQEVAIPLGNLDGFRGR